MNEDQEIAIASHPGKIVPSFTRYLRYFPKPLLPHGAAMLCATAFAIRAGWKSAWLLIIVLVAALFRGWRLRQIVKRHFRIGCLNPARVLQSDPLLLAVYTDLISFGDQPARTVKVIRHPRLSSDRFKTGDRCVTVSLYYGFVGRPKWEDFDPILVNAATADPHEIAKAMARLEAEDWIILDQFIPQLPKPFQPGLYPVSPPK